MLTNNYNHDRTIPDVVTVAHQNVIKVQNHSRCRAGRTIGAAHNVLDWRVALGYHIPEEILKKPQISATVS